MSLRPACRLPRRVLSKLLIIVFVLKYVAFHSLLFSKKGGPGPFLFNTTMENEVEIRKLNNTVSEGTPESIHVPKLVIAGTVRNSAKWLPHVFDMIHSRIMTTRFQVIQILFFENDSTDDTLYLLRNHWKKFEPAWQMDLVRIINETGLDIRFKSNQESREVRLAHGRNMLWKTIVEKSKDRSESLFSELDYVLMMDMDDVNRKLDHIEQCFNLPTGWGACCVNQWDIYYDLWALRTFDDWVDVDVLPEPLRVTAGRHRHIPPTHPPIPVKSCFGGMVLYDFRQLQGIVNLKSAYKGVYEGSGDRKCEHVAFHEHILEQKEFHLYIQPNFLNKGPVIFKPKVRQRLHGEVNKSLHDPEMAKWYSTLE